MSTRHAIRRHIEWALEALRTDADNWQQLAEASAFVADGAELVGVAGLCRGAAASPAREAVPLLEEALHALRA